MRNMNVSGPSEKKTTLQRCRPGRRRLLKSRHPVRRPQSRRLLWRLPGGVSGGSSDVTQTVPNIWYDNQPLASQTKSDPVHAASLPNKTAWRAARQSRWKRWLYAAPARVGRRGRFRVWRVGAAARMLKRQSKHWRSIYQAVGRAAVHATYWWLANAYRLVYPRKQWRRIQGHLLHLSIFPSCRRICDLVTSVHAPSPGHEA